MKVDAVPTNCTDLSQCEASRFTRCARILMLLLSLSLVSCAGRALKKREAALEAAVKAYNNDLRWQKFGGAARYVEKDLRTSFLEFHAAQQDAYSINDIDIATVEMDEEDKLKGLARVWVSYVRLPSPSLRRDLQVQNWKYSEEKEQWFIEEPLAQPKKKAAGGK